MLQSFLLQTVMFVSQGETDASINASPVEDFFVYDECMSGARPEVRIRDWRGLKARSGRSHILRPSRVVRQRCLSRVAIYGSDRHGTDEHFPGQYLHGRPLD